jgi:hypothetical protein
MHHKQTKLNHKISTHHVTRWLMLAYKYFHTHACSTTFTHPFIIKEKPRREKSSVYSTSFCRKFFFLTGTARTKWLCFFTSKKKVAMLLESRYSKCERDLGNKLPLNLCLHTETETTVARNSDQHLWKSQVLQRSYTKRMSTLENAMGAKHPVYPNFLLTFS